MRWSLALARVVGSEHIAEADGFARCVTTVVTSSETLPGRPLS